MSHAQTQDGLTTTDCTFCSVVADVTFGDFKDANGDVVFSTNPLSHDLSHPFELDTIEKDNVDLASLIFYHRPDVG